MALRARQGRAGRHATSADEGWTDSNTPPWQIATLGLGPRYDCPARVSSSTRLLALFVCRKPPWPALLLVSTCLSILLILHGRDRHRAAIRRRVEGWSDADPLDRVGLTTD